MNLNGMSEISMYFIQFRSNVTQIHSNVIQIHSMFTQVCSMLLQIGSIRVKQMTGHLNDWTHSDLYECFCLEAACTQNVAYRVGAGLAKQYNAYGLTYTHTKWS